MLPPGMRERVDAAHKALNKDWYADWESRGCRNSEVRIVPVVMAPAAPAEQPKREIRPSYGKQSKTRVGLQTGKKSALTIGQRGEVTVTPKAEHRGRVAVEPRDPATCTHFQRGKSLWYKNGKGKMGQQKVICPACMRESQMVDGVVVDPGPYVAPKVPNPPADLPRFIAEFAAKYGYTYDDVRGASRLGPIVNMRRELCIVLTEQQFMSNRQIAAAINKDGASVQYLLATRKVTA